MPNPKNVHVVPNKADNNWRVTSEGAKRAAGAFDNKNQAINLAKGIAQNKHGEMFIHNQDGKISNRNTYGHDPLPPLDQVH